MKLTITEEDIRRLEGRFIIQVNHNDRIFLNEVKEERLPFFMDKRVRFIARGGKGVISCDLYGGSYDQTLESFVKMFNGDAEADRFHRLLTQREMDVVNKFMKLRQY